MDLGNSNLGHAHAHAALHPPTLADISAVDLGNNNLGPEGAAALADLLRSARGLEEVNIYMNDVGDSGAFKVRGPGLETRREGPCAHDVG